MRASVMSVGRSFGSGGGVLGQARYCGVSAEAEFGGEGGFLRGEFVGGIAFEIRVGDLVCVHRQAAENGFRNDVVFGRGFVFGVGESHEVPSRYRVETGRFVGLEGSRDSWGGTEDGFVKDGAVEVVGEGISLVRASKLAGRAGQPEAGVRAPGVGPRFDQVVANRWGETFGNTGNQTDLVDGVVWREGESREELRNARLYAFS